VSCAFCAIRDGRDRASIVYEDEQLLAFMDIRPVRRGQLLVVPRQHIDEFADLPDDLATAVFLAGQRLARVIRGVFAPKRVGLIVHGFGVAHAHLVVVPLEHAWDITAAQFAVIEDTRVVFRWEAVPLADRQDLDAIATTLREQLGHIRGGLPHEIAREDPRSGPPANTLDRREST
jgi:histidine triad (HIT) family protein